MLIHPGVGSLFDGSLLLPADRIEGVAEVGPPPRPDFHEGNDPVTHRDEVDLAPTTPEVSAEHHPTPFLEVHCGGALRPSADFRSVHSAPEPIAAGVAARAMMTCMRLPNPLKGLEG